MPKPWRTLIRTATPALLVVLASCSSNRFMGADLYGEAAEPTPALVSVETDGQPTTERESGLRIGKLSAEGVLPADAFWLRPEMRAVFRRSEEGETIEVERAMSEPDPEGVRTILITSVGDGAVVGRTSIERREDGAIVIRENKTSDIESAFTPAALLSPRELAVGVRVEEPFEVKTTGRPVTSGTGDGAVELTGLGTQDVETGLGVVRAFVIESEMSFKIGPARIVLSQRSWVDPTPGGFGLVAEESRDSVKVFGIGVHSADRVSLIQRVGTADAED
ncbi:MAG: hypothetical protein AAF108_02690 [Planctomycetota bacterium]